jgi:hypothetical protein
MRSLLRPQTGTGAAGRIGYSIRQVQVLGPSGDDGGGAAVAELSLDQMLDDPDDSGGLSAPTTPAKLPVALQIARAERASSQDPQFIFE